jgi:2-C-methyl-D-erythritol 4-phosphate cytidylyltransferase
VLGAAARVGGAIPVAPLVDLVAVDGRPLPQPLVGVQTPQAFRARALLAAHLAAAADGAEATDTAGILMAYADLAIAAVTSSARNLKLTVPDDFVVAEALIGG